uniref:Uncharacterized protein n=1 Tax=Pelodiscus sinensis TaxID=13735 RepID=K7EXC7_PELSI
PAPSGGRSPPPPPRAPPPPGSLFCLPSCTLHVTLPPLRSSYPPPGPALPASSSSPVPSSYPPQPRTLTRPSALPDPLLPPCCSHLASFPSASLHAPSMLPCPLFVVPTHPPVLLSRPPPPLQSPRLTRLSPALSHAPLRSPTLSCLPAAPTWHPSPLSSPRTHPPPSALRASWCLDAEQGRIFPEAQCRTM